MAEVFAIMLSPGGSQNGLIQKSAGGHLFKPLSDSDSGGRVAVDVDSLVAAGLAGGDLQAGLGHPECPGQQLDAGLVGGALDRRGGDLQLKGIVLHADDLVARGFRLNANSK